MRLTRLVCAFLFVVVLCYGQTRIESRIGSNVIVSERGQNERSKSSRTYITKDIFGNTIIKDGNDHTIKSIEKDIFGNIIIKDGNGHKLKSIEKDIFGRTYIKDGNGHTIQSVEKDIFGNTIVKDGNGHTILTIGQGIFGAFVIKDEDGDTLFSYIRDRESNKLVIKESPGREMIDKMDLVLLFNFDDKSPNVLLIEQSPYYLYWLQVVVNDKETAYKKTTMEKTHLINKKSGGILIAIFFLGLTYFLIQQFFFKEPSFDKEIEKASMALNKECPMIIDQYTRLDHTEALPNKTIKYNYTLVEMEKSEVQIDTIRKYVEPAIIENIRNNADMKAYRNNKTTFVYSYKDKNGVFVYEFKATPDVYERN